MTPRKAWRQLINFLDLSDAHVNGRLVELFGFPGRSGGSDEHQSVPDLDVVLLLLVRRSGFKVPDFLLSHTFASQMTNNLLKILL